MTKLKLNIFRSTVILRRLLLQCFDTTFRSEYREMGFGAKQISSLEQQPPTREVGLRFEINMSEDSHTSEEIVSEEEKQPPKKRTKKIAKTKKKDDSPKEKETKEKDSESKEESNDEVPEKKTKKTRGPKKSKLDHPRTIDMILEAIENLEDSRGSSVQSIKSYIMTNFKVRDDMIKSMMRRALAIAVKDNVLIRPKNQVQKSQLLSGRYLIRPKSKEEIEPPKPRPSKLRQLGVLKPKKGKKSKGKKRKRKGFY